MPVGSGIDQDAVNILFESGVNSIDDVAFTVGLKRIQLDGKILCQLSEQQMYIIKRRCAINISFALTEQVEIRSSYDEDAQLRLFFFHGFERTLRFSKKWVVASQQPLRP